MSCRYIYYLISYLWVTNSPGMGHLRDLVHRRMLHDGRRLNRWRLDHKLGRMDLCIFVQRKRKQRDTLRL